MNTDKTNYVKRTQKDYSLSFKLHVVQELEQGFLTRVQAMDKYGNFDSQYTSFMMKSKTPEQRILELEQENALLKKQKARAEHLADRADKKVILFDMMIDIAEQEFNIPIRKKHSPELSKDSQNKKKKQ